MKALEATKKVTGYVKDLAESVDSTDKNGRYQAWLNLMTKFHQYSYHNSLLILIHRPDATLVRGYNQWKELKRFVKKGERGIPILVPMWVKTDPDYQTEYPARKMIFAVRYVFDISQTEGDPLDLNPDLPDTDDHFDVLYKLIEYAERSGITVTIDADISARGNTNAVDFINLAGDMSVDARLKVFLHELAHIRCNHKPGKQSKQTVELEAESVAYVVGRILGIPVNGAEIYLAEYDITGDMLRESMDRIVTVAQDICKEFNENGITADVEAQVA